MGYIRHQAIVVTGRDNSAHGGTNCIGVARGRAVALGLLCSEIVAGGVNGYLSFLIAPDGSKEGRKTSDDFENLRAEWIRQTRESESCVDWALVSFGGDDAELAHLEDWSDNEGTPKEENK